MTMPKGRQELSQSKCKDCGHDGYAHRLPSAHIMDTVCDAPGCDCSRFRPDPNELSVLLGVPEVER